VFSDGFSEGQARDIDGGFPSGSLSYTDDYDYLSDSDLEDGSSCSEEEDEGPPEDGRPELSNSPRNSESRVALTPPSKYPPRPLPDTSKVQNDDM